MKKKYILFFLIVTISIIGIVSANTNIINNSTQENGTIEDYNAFSPASKIAFNDLCFLKINLVNLDIPSNMRNYAGLVTFFNSIGMIATPVQTTKEHLQPGDIVQLKNTDSSFLVYIGTHDNIIELEDVDYRYECSLQSFDLLFSGNAIFLNHNSSSMSLIDGSKINDNPIHDPNIHTAPIITGESSTIASFNEIINEVN